MKVSELIACLQSMDPNASVVFVNNDDVTEVNQVCAEFVVIAGLEDEEEY
jgi:hypothetical protein